MTGSILVQYIGFRTNGLSREYTFNVRGDGEDREFTVNIANEAFVSHRARYQDAPAICAGRLQAELAAHENHPIETRFVISSAELETYRAARAPKGEQKMWSRKTDEY
ncbi:MAG TPA: hypothetical protein VK728_15625 [Candidatus Sulfotelmatobacter sp.]|jgi:hypothetical protein|nr:hypothetical protein [Candidatus Sulfotelmatobacter sp.]